MPSPPDATRAPGFSAASELPLLGVPIDPPGWILPRFRLGSGASGASGSPGSPRRTLRGIYSGGTLCVEARLIAGTGEFTDFGDDAYTRGRPHPMIDPSLRLEALAEVPPGAVVLLDVVLGHGADPDPSVRLAPAIAATVARGVPVVVVLVGTSGRSRRGWNARPRRCTRPGPPCSRPTRGPPASGRCRREQPVTHYPVPVQESSMTLPMLSGEPEVITVGADVLGEALDAQAVPRVRVDWRPPTARHRR